MASLFEQSVLKSVLLNTNSGFSRFRKSLEQMIYFRNMTGKDLSKFSDWTSKRPIRLLTSHCHLQYHSHWHLLCISRSMVGETWLYQLVPTCTNFLLWWFYSLFNTNGSDIIWNKVSSSVFHRILQAVFVLFERLWRRHRTLQYESSSEMVQFSFDKVMVRG